MAAYGRGWWASVGCSRVKGGRPGALRMPCPCLGRKAAAVHLRCSAALPLCSARQAGDGLAYLVLHDGLLEARALHGDGARLLARAPRALAVGRLRGAQLLALCDALLEHLVEGALGRRGRGVGLGDVGRDAALPGVIGGHLVDRGRGSCVAAEERKAARGAAGAEGAGEHGGRGNGRQPVAGRRWR
jgi:hypothetical protein